MSSLLSACLSSCHSQVVERDVVFNIYKLASCADVNVCKLFTLSPTVWDDPSHACCVQRKSRHVQIAAATWSRCELQ